MSAPTKHTSITVAQHATGDFAQDQQTRTWVLPPGMPEPHPVQIVEYAQRRSPNSAGYRMAGTAQMALRCTLLWSTRL